VWVYARLCAFLCVCNVWVDECAWECGRVGLCTFMRIFVCVCNVWVDECAWVCVRVGLCTFMRILCVCNVWVDECAWACGRVGLCSFMRIRVCAMYGWMSVHGCADVWIYAHLCTYVCVQCTSG